MSLTEVHAKLSQLLTDLGQHIGQLPPDPSRGASAEPGDATSGTVTIAAVRDAIEDALAESLRVPSRFEVTATLTMKVKTSRTLSAGVKLDISGVAGSAGGQHGSTNTQSTIVTFVLDDRRPTESDDDRTDPTDLQKAFAELGRLLGLGAGSPRWTDAEVELDFAVDRNAHISILVGADARDDSTHKLKIAINRKDPSPAPNANEG